MKKLCISLFILLLAQPVLASYDLDAIKSLDLIFKHLDASARHSKDAKALGLSRAYGALEAKKTGRARKLAVPALKDSMLSDYAHWIIGSADLDDAQKDAAAKKPNAGAAERAFRHFSAIADGSPYSPLIHEVPRLLGQSELLAGYGLEPGRESVLRFEDALMRLASSGSLWGVTPDETLGFAKACKKSPDDLCEPWLLRLTERMDRDSDEFDAIAELFPLVKDRPRKPELPPRSTQSYKAPDLDFAAFDAAMGSYSSGKWSDAQDKLQAFGDEFPKSIYRYRARYWLARTLMAENKKDDAKKEYTSLLGDSPLSYYGLLSTIDTGNPIDKAISQTPPQGVDRDPLLSAGELYHLKRAERLLAAKAGDLATMDLREIRPRNALSSPFLMYLCALNYRAKNYPTLFVLLSELIQREYPEIPSDSGLKMIFPVEDMDQITLYARQDKLDPILVLSLIKQESAFDPHAQSGAGAAGLMQLMYFTATQMTPGISRDDLLDPNQNVKTGARYLANLMDRYHGNIVFSLAAYNAGPAAVDRWIRDAQTRKLGMLEFIEAIPYRETREYVSAIIRNYYWYSKILGGTVDPDTAKVDPKPLSYFWKGSP